MTGATSDHPDATDLGPREGHAVRSDVAVMRAYTNRHAKEAPEFRGHPHRVGLTTGYIRFLE
jgi:hypothetical protein